MDHRTNFTVQNWEGHPEDVEGHTATNPTSLWTLGDFRALEGLQDAKRRAISLSSRNGGYSQISGHLDEPHVLSLATTVLQKTTSWHTKAHCQTTVCFPHMYRQFPSFACSLGSTLWIQHLRLGACTGIASPLGDGLPQSSVASSSGRFIDI